MLVENRISAANVLSILNISLNVEINAVEAHSTERIGFVKPTNGVNCHFQCRRSPIKSASFAFVNVVPVKVVGYSAISILKSSFISYAYLIMLNAL